MVIPEPLNNNVVCALKYAIILRIILKNMTGPMKDSDYSLPIYVYHTPTLFN